MPKQSAASGAFSRYHHPFSLKLDAEQFAVGRDAIDNKDVHGRFARLAFGVFKVFISVNKSSVTKGCRFERETLMVCCGQLLELAAGLAMSISRVAWRPLSTGMAMSMRMTSGWRIYAIFTASRPFRACPTTLKQPSFFNSAHIPCRTGAWSSAISTVIFLSFLRRPVVEGVIIWRTSADVNANCRGIAMG
jgi:hypothetical protein